MGREDGRERRAAGLFLALEEKADVHGQAPLDFEEGDHRLERDQHWPFVVRDAPPVEAPVTHRRLEGGRLPEVERIGGLHVVMAVDDQGRGAFGPEPLGIDRGLTAAVESGQATQALEPGVGQAGFEEAACGLHSVGIGRVGPDGRLRDKGGESREKGIALAERVVKNRVRHATPPSTESTCPVTHSASSDTKNAAAAAMSSGRPSRRVWIRSISWAWPSGP